MRGLWRIEFKEAWALMDIDGGTCDYWNKCDAYIKIIVDDTEVFRSVTVLNNDRPNFKETFQMDLCADSKIVLEMWDEDVKLQGADDLMGRWGPLNVFQIGSLPLFEGPKRHRGFQNLIKARSSWTKL